MRETIRKLLLLTALCAATAGCVAPGVGPTEPPGISNQIRDQIHRLAISGPNAPSVQLTSDLDGKGAAAGKTAVYASMKWLGGTMQAASEGEEAGVLVLAVGLMATPFVAAGGALYGAAAADSGEAIAEGNQTLNTVLEFAPDRFRNLLERQFTDSVPVSYEFTGDLSDAELASLGFDAVLDIQMDSLASAPSENGFHTYFNYTNRAELRVFGRPDLTRTRVIEGMLPNRAVSSWARDGGRQLLADLDTSYEADAGEILDYFFLDDSILVQGMEPVSRGWRVGEIDGTRPMIVWTARDGRLTPENDRVEYELRLYTGSRPPETGIRTTRTRYVPPDTLKACQQYRWQVRAHYQSFGEPAQSDWTPVYRFRTSCERGRRS